MGTGDGRRTDRPRTKLLRNPRNEGSLDQSACKIGPRSRSAGRSRSTRSGLETDGTRLGPRIQRAPDRAHGRAKSIRNRSYAASIPRTNSISFSLTNASSVRSIVSTPRLQHEPLRPQQKKEKVILKTTVSNLWKS